MRLDNDLIARILSGTATLEDLAGVPPEEVFALRSDPENVQWVESGELLEVRATQGLTAERSATYVMSTANPVGRTKDVIEVNGWDLGDFNKRGRPLLYNHNLTESHDHLPLGRMDGVRSARARGQSALVGDAVFTPQGMVPFNDMVFRLIDEDFLPGSSVGYRSLATRMPKDQAEVEKRGLGPMSVIITRASLMEFSVTPVGMDPDATKLTALNHRLRSWEDEYGRDAVQHFRECTRGLEPEKRTQIQVPALPFAIGVSGAYTAQDMPTPAKRSSSSADATTTATGITFNEDGSATANATEWHLVPHANAPVPRSDAKVLEALHGRVEELEQDIAATHAYIDTQGERFDVLSRSVQNILEAFGVRAAPPIQEEQQADTPATGGADDLYAALFDDDTMAALFGGGSKPDDEE